MLKKELKRSSRYDEDGALPELVGKDLERNLDNVDSKMEDDEENLALDDQDLDAEGDIEDDVENTEDEPADDVPDHLETDLEEPEEQFKDINEKMVVYLYRGFAELGDEVRLFVEDEDNEERDPELVDYMKDFMEGYPDVMDAIKELADKYVTSVDLFDPEEGEEVGADDAEDDIEDDTEADDMDDVELDDDIEDAEVVESYVREHNLDHNRFESEYEIYAGYKSSEEADKFEEDFRKFKNAEVFRHEDIGEVHAYIKVK